MALRLPHGLTITVNLEANDDKPILFTFTYTLDQAALKRNLIANRHLCEGALSFVSKGIEITVPYGPDKIDKAGFSIDDTHGERIWLPLLERPVIFRVHRNLFGGVEWECYYDDQQ